MPRARSVAVLTSLFISMLVASSSPAHAGLRLEAVYTDGTATLVVPIQEGAMLPTWGEGLTLHKLQARIEGEPALRDIRNVVFLVTCDGAERPAHKAQQGEFVDGVATVMGESNLRSCSSRGTAQQISVTMQIKPESEFLCAHELVIRSKDGREPSAAELRAFGKKSKAYPLMPGLQLSEGSGLLRYSFCDPRSWQSDFWVGQHKLPPAAKSLLHASTSATPEELQARHKAALATRVAARVRSESKLELETVEHEGRTNLAIIQRFRFDVVSSQGLLSVQEHAYDGVRCRIEHEAVDQDSQLELELAPTSNGLACAHLPRMPLTVTARITSRPDEPEVKVELSDRDGCRFRLKFDLRSYLEERIELKVTTPLTGARNAVLLRSQFTVRNFGLITTFPVVSEVVAAIDGWSKRDAESLSSVPLSLVVDLSEGSGVLGPAVTFPWKLSLNTRGGEDLTHIISAFPHVTLAYTERDGATMLAGLGVQLVDLFTFALGWQVTAGPTQGDARLLIGLDLTGLSFLNR
ncbi:MAG TPA: hypothetical protein PK095_09680 [Myxococcota bacterium]|nr:hypothetical protein [Myxococcota bacterium]